MLNWNSRELRTLILTWWRQWSSRRLVLVIMRNCWLEMCVNGFQHSHSLPFPSIQFPFPPIPIPIFTYSHSHGIPLWAIPIPILSVLKLYIISDTVMFLMKEILTIYYHYAQTRTRSRINYISVVCKLGTISIIYPWHRGEWGDSPPKRLNQCH